MVLKMYEKGLGIFIIIMALLVLIVGIFLLLYTDISYSAIPFFMLSLIGFINNRAYIYALFNSIEGEEISFETEILDFEEKEQ